MSSGIFLYNNFGIVGPWKVASQTNEYQHYIVVQVNEECSCLLRCTSCHVCIHMFSYSCADAHLHNTVCKHVFCVVYNSIRKFTIITIIKLLSSS